MQHELKHPKPHILLFSSNKPYLNWHIDLFSWVELWIPTLQTKEREGVELASASCSPFKAAIAL